MRSIALVWAAALLLVVPGLAQAADDDEHPGRFLRMLRSWTDYAAARLQANENVVDPFRVDGKANTVVNIDSIVLNVELGDLMITENSTEGGGAELVHRLLDLMTEQKQPGHAPHPPEMWPPEMRPWCAPPAGRGERAQEFRERAGRTAEAGGPPPRPEVMELLMQIPPDMEPEFIEFMMHVGKLAREYPDFRERLELLVERAQRATEEH